MTGRRAQAVIDDMLKDFPYLRGDEEEIVKGTLAYQMAALTDALEDLGRAILKPFKRLLR